MTANRSRTDGGEQTTNDGKARGASRRDFMRATAAGAGALAFGSTVAGSAAAQAEPQIPTPRLSVDGNTFADPAGNTVKLRGLNIADPKRMNVEAPAIGKTAVQAVEFLTNQEEGWYPRVIRIPVQPIDVGEHTPGHVGGPVAPPSFTEAELETYLETHLDPVVEACRERGVYAIVDYHRHWTIENGEGDEWLGWWATTQSVTEETEIEEALQAEVTMFWDVVAARYGEDDHVLFEVYNEPTHPGMWNDPFDREHLAVAWMLWVEMAQPWIDAVREHTDTPILLGSPSWTQSPEGILLEEEHLPDWSHLEYQQFEDPEENLAMTFHIYPGHEASMADDWEDPGINGQGVAGVYEEYPLVVTEFGWDTLDYDDTDSPTLLSGSVSDFGEPFMEWLESSPGINWTAWCAHPTWYPAMFDRPFVPEDAPDEPYENPYEESVPEYCSDLPCEWDLLGEDVGEYDDYMGGFIKDTLADNRDDGIPSGEITPPEPSDPDPPTGLEVVSVGETSLELAWSGDADATGYAVSVDGTLETEVTGTSATLEGLDPDTTYEVGVTSLGADGFESEETAVTATTAEADGPGDCAAEEIQVGENCATDVDGNGLYRDVDGTGTTGSNDVVQFFRHVEDEAVQANPDAFDFNESGGVGFDDVVALFGQI